jgi:hypothetical protein
MRWLLLAAGLAAVGLAAWVLVSGGAAPPPDPAAEIDPASRERLLDVLHSEPRE